MDVDWLKIAFGLLVAGGILAVVVGGPLIAFVVSRTGVAGTALVKEIGYSAVRDEQKRLLHRMVLEVRLPGQAPYDVTVTQLLPWMHGPGLAGHEVPVKAHRMVKRWVVVQPPKGPEGVAPPR